MDENQENVKYNNEKNSHALKKEAKEEEEQEVEIEPKTRASFAVKLNDGKRLISVGCRKKSILGLGINIYGFGIYADNEKLKELLKSSIGKSPAKPTEEMFCVIIDSDIGMAVRLVIAFSSLTMSMVKKGIDEGIGASIKKLTGGRQNGELTKKMMSEASNSIKLTFGSEIIVSRLPGYILQTKVNGEVIGTVQSELLCRAYFHAYLGEDPFDKDAKEKFGMSLLSLF